MFKANKIGASSAVLSTIPLALLFGVKTFSCLHSAYDVSIHVLLVYLAALYIPSVIVQCVAAKAPYMQNHAFIAFMVIRKHLTQK